MGGIEEPDNTLMNIDIRNSRRERLNILRKVYLAGVSIGFDFMKSSTLVSTFIKKIKADSNHCKIQGYF